MDVCGFTPTNSLASASFDVLNISGVEDPLINVNRLASTDFEESYFASAIAHINETRNDYTNAKIVLYKAISEAQTQQVVLESFSDFFIKVREIIEKFLQFIKKMFARFLTNLNKLIGSETYLKKHKKDFDDFKSGDEFEFEGYNYTFSESIPLANAALEYNYSLFDKMWDDSTGDLNIASVRAATTNLNDTLEEDYAKFRAQVLCRYEDNSKIYTTDYADELFRVYRDGDDSTSKITADFSYIRNAKDRFFSYDKTKKHVDRQYKQVEDAYKRVEKDVQEIVKRNGDLNSKAFYDNLPDMSKASNIAKIDGHDISNAAGLNGFTMSKELMSQIDIYVKAKVDQIQEYSNIHTLAFAAKLDAMSECYRQDKYTLYTALTRIQRTDKKREGV